ncbi:hypothetical protein I4U23_012742 [Adineta vaga]|nr:hypothetical protein I4U23_012742 [Adineta vaga]
MVSEGKEQAIKYLSKADLAFIAILLDIQGGLMDDSDQTKNIYRLTFENIQVIHGELNETNDDTQFEYEQNSKGLQFKLENQNDKRTTLADDEMKEPKEGQTYVAILTDPKHITVLVEINPNDINEIIQSTPITI